MKLDYSIESPEERKKYVDQIIASSTEELSPQYLEILADYLVTSIERKEKKILTENRMATINKRETSLEGLASTLESGEDGLYNLISEDKNVIFQPKVSITQKDLKEIPPLAQLRKSINSWETSLKKSSGKQAYIIKKSLIEMRKDQYIIKNAFRAPIVPNKLIKTPTPPIELEDYSIINKKGEITIQGISLMDPKVTSAILCNYSKLRASAYSQFNGDLYYLLEDFDTTASKALAESPLYDRLVELKVDGMPNIAIQKIIEEEFNTKYSIEYISSLWRNKIPKLIARQATKDFLTFEYNKLGYPLKTCTKCGQALPAHNLFYSINNDSKDGFYSICKKCRNKKKEAK